MGHMAYLNLIEDLKRSIKPLKEEMAGEEQTEDKTCFVSVSF